MDDYIDTLLFALRQRECTPLTAEYRCVNGKNPRP